MHLSYKTRTLLDKDMEFTRSYPMTIEAIRTPLDGSNTNKQRTRLGETEADPSFMRPLRGEELMQFGETEQLLPYVRAQAARRFPFHVNQLMSAVDIGITQYHGHTPRRDGTEASIHQVRTLYRALLDDPELTPVQGAILGNHDTIEDLGLTQRDFAELLGMREDKFSPKDISRIAFGVNIFSRIRDGKKLSQPAYMGGLEDLHWADCDLGVIGGKAWDGIDNGENDKFILINDPPSIDPKRVLDFVNGKLEDVHKLAKRYIPQAISTHMLADTIRTARRLALRELEIRELGIRENETRKAKLGLQQRNAEHNVFTDHGRVLSPTR